MKSILCGSMLQNVEHKRLVCIRHNSSATIINAEISRGYIALVAINRINDTASKELSISTRALENKVPKQIKWACGTNDIVGSLLTACDDALVDAALWIDCGFEFLRKHIPLLAAEYVARQFDYAIDTGDARTIKLCIERNVDIVWRTPLVRNDMLSASNCLARLLVGDRQQACELLIKHAPSPEILAGACTAAINELYTYKIGPRVHDKAIRWLHAHGGKITDKTLENALAQSAYINVFLEMGYRPSKQVIANNVSGLNAKNMIALAQYMPDILAEAAVEAECRSVIAQMANKTNDKGLIACATHIELTTN